MWLCALLALAALHEAQCLHEVRPFNVDPNAISNIELLVPLALPAAQPERGADRPPERDERTASDERRDRDQPFSSIPAYAFTLDTGASSPRAVRLTPNMRALPKFIQNRALYVAKLWSRDDAQTERPRDTAQKISQEACRELARQQQGSARELLMYICSELMDLLVARCDCCDEEQDGRAHSTSDQSNLLIPWLQSLGTRRMWHVGDNMGQLQNHYSENSRPRPRVFV